MASGTELEAEELDDVATGNATVREKERVRPSRESAVWLYFDKMDRVSGGESGDRMAKCKDCGATVKVSKGNTSNLMSHLRARHPKIHEVARQKMDEKKLEQASQAKKKSVNTQQQTTLPGIAARKEKLDSNSALHKKITRGIAGTTGQPKIGIICL